jgi:hypothetical protein
MGHGYKGNKALVVGAIERCIVGSYHQVSKKHLDAYLT